MAEEQLGFDMGEKPSEGSALFDPEEIRADLDAILADARGVTEAGQWSERTLKYNRIVFPQMAKWLPDEEAAQLCFAFAREVERIELLMAA